MDNYTKFILTVIAVSMFKIAFFEIKPIENAYAWTPKYGEDGGITNIDEYHAENKVIKIAICDESGKTCADMLRTYGSGDKNLLGTYSNQ